jgi:uncharacterized protein (TIGR00290 family)
MNKALLFWSSGKDSAAALQALDGSLEVESLVTTVNRPESRVAVHRVPERLLERQASALDLPLEKIVIPAHCPNEEYERAVLGALEPFRDRGIDIVVFGDINLADIRTYREELLSRLGMQCVFPLWGRDTTRLAADQLASGIRAVVTCVDNSALAGTYAGRELDRSFIDSLPEDADPCGENGEFHTFVYDAAIFSAPVPYAVVRTTDEGAFTYAIIAEESEEPVHDH